MAPHQMVKGLAICSLLCLSALLALSRSTITSPASASAARSVLAITRQLRPSEAPTDHPPECPRPISCAPCPTRPASSSDSSRACSDAVVHAHHAAETMSNIERAAHFNITENWELPGVLSIGGARPGRCSLPHQRYITVIMAVWDEAFTLPLALDSTRHFATEYIVVHKPGSDATEELLRLYAQEHGLRVRYFRSAMTLRQARLFSLHISQSYTDMYVIQDGDEVYYSSGPTAIQNSLHLLDSGYYRAIDSKMIYLKGDLLHTVEDKYKPGSAGKWGGHPANNIQLIPHPTIFLNDPDRIAIADDLTVDVPGHTGPIVVLHDPWKFDISIKHPLRELLRDSFLQWSAAGSPGTIEEFAVKHNRLHQDLVAAGKSRSLLDTARVYVEEHLPRFLQPYSQDEWFRYPDAIAKYVAAGRVRGYDPADGAML